MTGSMNARTLLFTGLCLTVTSSANAQISDALAQTSFEHFPSAKNDDTSQSLRLEVFRAAAGVPLPVAERTTLLVGAAYELIDVHPSDAQAFQLHAPKASLGVIQGFSEHWGMMAFGDVGFASDFSDDLSSEDALLSLTAVATYKLNEAFTLGVGAVYDRRTGKLAPLPALLLNWRISERARVRGFAPARVTAEYRAATWLDVGLRGSFDGNRFHLGEQQFGQSKLELAYSNLEVGPQLTFSVSNWVHFDVYAAAAVYRRYELFQDDRSFAKYELAPVVGYGARFWIGPSRWRPSPAVP
jgi:hypothetical protein